MTGRERASTRAPHDRADLREHGEASGQQLYCPRETTDMHSGSGVFGAGRNRVLCPGGKPLQAGRCASDLFHPLDEHNWLDIRLNGRSFTVTTHNVWRSRALTFDEAQAQGLRVRPSGIERAADRLRGLIRAFPGQQVTA